MIKPPKTVAQTVFGDVFLYLVLHKIPVMYKAIRRIKLHAHIGSGYLHRSAAEASRFADNTIQKLGRDALSPVAAVGEHT